MTIHSVQTFTDALGVVIAEYLTHLEPTADVKIYSVRLEVSGPHLTIHYDQAGDNPASLTVSLPALPKPPEQQAAEKGVFRR